MSGRRSPRSRRPRLPLSSASSAGLLPAATLASSRAELEAIAGRLAAAYPASNTGMGARVITLQEEIVEPQARQAGTICLVAVFFVLLIACANVANLLLARGATRSRELSVRAALGAGRGRLVRQLMTESFMLAAVGCALGLVLSLWGIQLFRTVIPSDFPRVDTLGIDAKVAVYALVVSVGGRPRVRDRARGTGDAREALRDARRGWPRRIDGCPTPPAPHCVRGG